MPPPKYPPICTVNDKHNLDKFWSCLKSEIITTTDDVPTTRIISEKEMNVEEVMSHLNTILECNPDHGEARNYLERLVSSNPK